MKLAWLGLGFAVWALVGTDPSLAGGGSAPGRDVRDVREEIRTPYPLTRAPFGVSSLKSACAFSPLGYAQDWILSRGLKLGRLTVDSFEFQRVSVLVGGEFIVGYVRRECLNDPVEGTLSPIEARLLGLSSAPSQFLNDGSGRGAELDYEALQEIGNRGQDQRQTRTLVKQFLSTTRIEPADLFNFSSPSPPVAITPKLVQASFEVVWDLLSTPKPACEQVPQALKLLQITFGSSKNLGLDHESNLLVLYALVFGAEKGLMPCSREIHNNLGQLAHLRLARPTNAFVEDQRWKRDFVGFDDEQMEQALERQFGRPVKVIRDDDISGDKRWLARTRWGSIEEIVYNRNPAPGKRGVEYRWTHPFPKEALKGNNPGPQLSGLRALWKL
jgi:hypothetical protein